MTKKPVNWKNFLLNSDNKSQLVNILYDVWSADGFAEKLAERKVLIVVQGHCYLLSTDGKTVKKSELPILFSSQEETDTRVILYCAYAQHNDYEIVRIRSPDSDIFFITLHHAEKFNITILFDTGSGNHKRLINISKLAKEYGQQFCSALLALHGFTHCDTTSAFKGIGKVKPIKLLERTPAFVEVLSQVGDSWNLSQQLVNGLEELTCAMYGKARYKTVDTLRLAILKEKCAGSDGIINIDRNIDLSQLPPCRKVLYEHIRRVNYQVRIWKMADISEPDLPKAEAGHGWKLVDHKLEPLWFEGPIISENIAIEDDDNQSDEENDSSDDESENGAMSEEDLQSHSDSEDDDE